MDMKKIDLSKIPNKKIALLLEPVVQRCEELEKEIHDPLFHQKAGSAGLAREHAAMNESLVKAAEWENVRNEMEHLKDLEQSSEPEISEMAKLERAEL